MLATARRDAASLALALVLWATPVWGAQVDMDLAEMYNVSCFATDASAQGCEGGTSCGTKCANDNDTATTCSKIGKSPEEFLRLDYDEDQADLTTSDHIDIYLGMAMNVDNISIVPYDSATTVCSSTSAPDCIISAAVASGWVSLTLTTDFINNLDGSGAFAIRAIVTNTDDTCSAGDLQYTEVDSYITVAGGSPSMGINIIISRLTELLSWVGLGPPIR